MLNSFGTSVARGVQYEDCTSVSHPEQPRIAQETKNSARRMEDGVIQQSFTSAYG